MSGIIRMVRERNPEWLKSNSLFDTPVTDFIHRIYPKPDFNDPADEFTYEREMFTDMMARDNIKPEYKLLNFLALEEQRKSLGYDAKRSGIEEMAQDLVINAIDDINSINDVVLSGKWATYYKSVYVQQALEVATAADKINTDYQTGFDSQDFFGPVLNTIITGLNADVFKDHKEKEVLDIGLKLGYRYFPEKLLELAPHTEKHYGTKGNA